MIELQRLTNYLNLEAAFSLHKILKTLLPSDYYEEESRPGIYCGFSREEGSYIKINNLIGNAKLSTTQLLYYPSLVKCLRKMKYYPIHTIRLPIKSVKNSEHSGLASTIEALHVLDQQLNLYREEKARLDAQINNLMMLHGQQTQRPIYQGAKPVYYSTSPGRRRKDTSRLVFISGVRYFSSHFPAGIYARKYQHQSVLYQLNARELLKQHLENNKKANAPNFDRRFIHVKGMVGGMIHTPIIIFRCAQSDEHKGKLYFLDLHQNNIMKTLSEARHRAESYAGKKYTIDLWE